ncbi:hypothetical protein BJX63DRAFT_430110 [Aspergillus granulosus]|uniref:Uncharacterized protein n=1 Tax=Aspergillus granulosus TaxID=176169 RepID=A0ABR4HMT4_9EURO
MAALTLEELLTPRKAVNIPDPPKTPTKRPKGNTNTIPPTTSASDSEDDNGSKFLSPDHYTPGSLWGSDDPKLQNILYLPTKDEQIVNTALLNYLSALILHAGLPLQWSLHLVSLRADFMTASYEARTDGYLECTRTDTGKGKAIRALVEVKPVTVAWLKTHPDTGGLLNERGRRIHVSQDRHLIYVIFAEYDDELLADLSVKVHACQKRFSASLYLQHEYVAYLNGDAAGPDTFLSMREYGPWDTRYPSHMQDLAPILVAIALRAQADLKVERDKAHQTRLSW